MLIALIVKDSLTCKEAWLPQVRVLKIKQFLAAPRFTVRGRETRY